MQYCCTKYASPSKMHSGLLVCPVVRPMRAPCSTHVVPDEDAEVARLVYMTLSLSLNEKVAHGMPVSAQRPACRRLQHCPGTAGVASSMPPLRAESAVVGGLAVSEAWMVPFPSGHVLAVWVVIRDGGVGHQSLIIIRCRRVTTCTACGLHPGDLDRQSLPESTRPAGYGVGRAHQATSSWPLLLNQHWTCNVCASHTSLQQGCCRPMYGRHGNTSVRPLKHCMRPSP